MADLQELIRAVDELNASDLKQLYNHIVETRIQFIASPEESQNSPRILGLFEHVGETWMSDDFDDELPDSFWLGEDNS
jgi:hypothetical protein